MIRSMFAWFVMIAFALPVAFATDVSAEPDCTKTERKDGKDQDGNTVNCLWTVCVETKCDDKGDKIENCRTETSYKDPRECRDAKPEGD